MSASKRMNGTKELSESTAASSVRREWAVPKAIESETSSSEQAVVTHGADSKDGKSSKNSKAPVGKDVTSDPNATGNGLLESSDLSFLSDLALSLFDARATSAFTKTRY